MKLSANVILKGKYYRAGEDIPDELLSDAMRKYAVSLDEERSRIQQQRRDADDVEWKPQARLSSKNYVRRDNAMKRADSVERIPGEALYKKDLGAPSPRYVRYGKVSL